MANQGAEFILAHAVRMPCNLWHDHDGPGSSGRMADSFGRRQARRHDAAATPILVASQNGRVEDIALLLQAEVDVNAADEVSDDSSVINTGFQRVHALSVLG